LSLGLSVFDRRWAIKGAAGYRLTPHLVDPWICHSVRSHDTQGMDARPSRLDRFCIVDRRAVAKKFFQVGFNKCGTTSIAKFFNRNGLPAVHWDGGRLALRMSRNLDNGVPILSGYEKYTAFFDMEAITDTEFVEGSKLYEELLDEVDDPMFILNTRNQNRWISSRLDHLEVEYANRQLQILGFDELSDLVTHWRHEWVAHHAAVVESVPSERLLVFDIENDPPEALCQFVGLPPQAAQHFKIEKFTVLPLGRLLSRHTPTLLKNLLITETKVKLQRVLRKRPPSPPG